MKRNPSIQVLMILTVVLFFSVGPIAADPPPIAEASLADIIAAHVGPGDSYVVISGKIDMGGIDYDEAAPILGYANFTETAAKWYFITQKKSAEAAGYKVVIVVPGTGNTPESWNKFKNWNQFEVASGKIDYRMKGSSKWALLDIAAPSFPKTYAMGPLQPK